MNRRNEGPHLAGSRLSGRRFSRRLTDCFICKSCRLISGQEGRCLAGLSPPQHRSSDLLNGWSRRNQPIERDLMGQLLYGRI